MAWRENLLEKVGALVTAILLVLYVQSQLHPIIERVYEVPIELVNVPVNYEVSVLTGSRLKITVRGVKEHVESVSADRIRATIDLKEVPLGETQVPVRIQYPPEWNEHLTLFPERQRVRVRIEQRLARQMLLKVVLSGTPGVREVLAEAIPEPMSVRVTGVASLIRHIRAVQVNFDLTGLQGDLEVETTPVAVDEQGVPVLNVQVNPSTVRLRVRLIPQPTSKTVPVSPRLGDLPPFPYRVVWFSVEPVSVQLRGSPARLAEINVIETQPISLKNMTQDAQLRVPLRVPTGVQVMGAREVRVQVRIERETPPSQTKEESP
ncbi:MAG: hypothetical protein C4337_02590 [Armatimonadota bacterium]|mgnify:FL=1